MTDTFYAIAMQYSTISQKNKMKLINKIPILFLDHKLIILRTLQIIYSCNYTESEHMVVQQLVQNLASKQ